MYENCLNLSLNFIVTLIFCSCENRYRNRATVNNNSSTDSDLKKSSTLEAQKRGLAKDAYQVTAAEYDQFFSYRYGLLYQKFSDEPFNGRIVTIENGDQGDFVSQDEAWKNGRKHGVSSRWFSNGIKMYERNYDEENGMAPLLVGGQMDKKNVCSGIYTRQESW